MSDQVIDLPAGQRFARITDVRKEGDEENAPLRLEFSFASETPVQRFSFERFEPINEVLDHSDESSANFDRLNDGAPLLFNHDFDAHIGIVERAWMDTDQKKAYATVRFGSNTLAKEKQKDVEDGILRNVSFMYAVHGLDLDREAEGELPTYRSRNWEAFEVSLVTVPADNSVGLGRSVRNLEKTYPVKVSGRSLATQQQEPEQATEPDDFHEAERSAQTKEEAVSDVTTQEPAANPAIDEGKIRAQVIEQVRETNKTLMGIAKDNGMGELGEQAVSEGWNKERLLEAVNARHREGFKPYDTSAGLSEKEQRQYSLIRALNARFYGEGEAGIEKEVHDELAKRMGREDWSSGKRSILIPLEVQNAMRTQARTQQTGAISTGGGLVQTQYGTFEDMLRHETILGQLGANFIGGLEGDFEMARKTAASQEYWVGEGDDVTKSSMAFGVLKGQPHTLGARIHFTRRMLQQGSEDVERVGREDIADTVAIAVDRAAFHGTGFNGQPLGIINTNGIGSVTGTTLSRAQLLEHEQNVIDAKVSMGASKSFVASTNVRRFARDLKEDTGSGMFAWKDNNTMIGYGASHHTNLDAGYLIFGAFQYMSVLDWGAMEIDQDPYTDHAAGGLYLRVLRDVDFIVRQLGAFSVQSGITA